MQLPVDILREYDVQARGSRDIGDRSRRVARNVNGPDDALAQPDVFLFAGELPVDDARFQPRTRTTRRRLPRYRPPPESASRIRDDHDAAEPIAQRPRVARVLEMTMGDQQQLNGLGLHTRRLDVAEEHIVGAAAAGIDQGGVAIETDQVDCGILWRRQLRPANLEDLVGDPHRASRHVFSSL
jgi:hypothetical protein